MATGQPIIGYRILSELGEGGMGKVFLGERVSDNYKVALKTIIPDAAMTQKTINMFLREISIDMQLDHPNIVKFVEAGDAGGMLWLAMEYIKGVDLWRMVSEEGTLSIIRSTTIIIQVLDALNYSHEQNFIHRDIKPQNILVKKEGNRFTAKITDFGLAKNYSQIGQSKMTLSGDTGGTVQFMPPEQMLDFKYVKPAGDIYSAGAVFYYMLTGGKLVYKDFYSGKDPILVILEANLTPISDWNSKIPLILWKIIKKSLLNSPENRYRTASEFAMALRRFLKAYVSKIKR